MNDASRWRVQLGAYVARGYAKDPRVEAVVIAGSAARGHADRFSDVELLVAWADPPSEAEREAIADSVATDVRLGPAAADATHWEDLFVGRATAEAANTGVLVEVTGIPSGVIEDRIADVTERFETDLDKQSLIHALVNGHVVTGGPLVAGWTAQAEPYPRPLAVRMAEAHGQIDFFSNWRKLLARGPNLMLIHEWFSRVEQQLLLVLQALNGRYHYKFKWIDQVLDELSIAPRYLPERLGRVHTEDVATSAEVLRELVEDVYDLVETHLPEVAVGRLREIFRWERREWDQPPPLRYPDLT